MQLFYFTLEPTPPLPPDITRTSSEFRYALDTEISKKLRKANPEAFQNILKRMLEAKGRGFWDPDDDVSSTTAVTTVRPGFVLHRNGCAWDACFVD